MTWDQFKEAVDKKLKDDGADGSIQIEYIDVGTMFVASDVRVETFGNVLRIMD